MYAALEDFDVRAFPGKLVNLLREASIHVR
jgi:hypothetical protein